MIIVSITDDTYPQLIKQLIKDESYHNLFFNITAVYNDQLSGHLAEYIRTIAKGLSVSHIFIILIFKRRWIHASERN